MFPSSAPNTHSFQVSIYPMLTYVDRFTHSIIWLICQNNLRVVHHVAVWLQTFTPISRSYRFTFRLQIPQMFIFLFEFGHCHGTLCLGFGLKLLSTVSYCQNIYKISGLISSVFLSTSYLHTLIVCKSILLPILIILIKPCVRFLLMWLVLFSNTLPLMLLFKVSLVVSWVSRENSLMRETQLLIVIVLPLMHPYFPFASLPYMCSTLHRVMTSCNALL